MSCRGRRIEQPPGRPRSFFLKRKKDLEMTKELTKEPTKRRHQVTWYSANMTAISDRDGNLVAVTAGPRSEANAQAFCDLLEMLAELDAAGIKDVEGLMRRAEACASDLVPDTC